MHGRNGRIQITLTDPERFFLSAPIIVRVSSSVSAKVILKRAVAFIESEELPGSLQDPQGRCVVLTLTVAEAVEAHGENLILARTSAQHRVLAASVLFTSEAGLDESLESLESHESLEHRSPVRTECWACDGSSQADLTERLRLAGAVHSPTAVRAMLAVGPKTLAITLTVAPFSRLGPLSLSRSAGGQGQLLSLSRLRLHGCSPGAALNFVGTVSSNNTQYFTYLSIEAFLQLHFSPCAPAFRLDALAFTFLKKVMGKGWSMSAPHLHANALQVLRIPAQGSQARTLL